MSSPKVLLVILGAASAFLLAATTASATPKVLTMYANGAPLSLGPPESDPFELRSASAVSIAVPEAGFSATCPAANDALLGGWVVANGQRVDEVQFNEEGGFNEVRACAGATVAGPLLVGTLKLHANGTALLVATRGERRRFQLEFNGCYFFASRMHTVATIGEPLTVSFSGVLKSKQEGCPREATIATGPFEAFFESNRVEDSVS